MSDQKNNRCIKHSKIEKQFYSEKNFKLLEDVILDMINKDHFHGNHKSIIFNSMEKVYKENTPPSNVSHENRKKVLTSLNKNVLAHVASQINQQPSTETPSPEKPSFVPAPESTFGHPLHNNSLANPPVSSHGLGSHFSGKPGGNRELRSFYAREFTQPLTTPSLHPTQQLENFPAPQNVNSSTNNTNIMFKKIEQERTNENATRRPKPVEFALPENTSDNVNPENKFKELMKKREIDDSELKNKILKPRETNIQSVEQVKFEPFPDNNSFLQQDAPKEPQYNSFIDGLDERLLATDEIVDTSVPSRTQMENKQSSQRNIPTTSFLPSSFHQQTLQPQTPQTRNPISSKPSFSPTIPSDIPKQIEKELKTFYLTILSKYRNTHNNPQPTSFTTTIAGNENNKTIVKVADEIIFEHNNKQTNNVDILNDKDIVSVECLDVVVPKINHILHEPYLWLCINEWKSTNFGPGVPDNAFARLKPLPGNSELPFITMRAHLLERQHPDELNEQLTLELLTSDGEPVEIQDKIEISNIQNNIIEVSKNHNVEKGDLLYVYSLYSKDVIGFYPNVYVHNIKVNGKEDNATLSLRLFIDKDANDPSNKIGTFADDKEKTSILSNKYLSVGDILFLEYVKSKKVTGTFEIIDVKNDIITIRFPQQSRRFTPKKITRLGFIQRKKEGYTSSNKKDINYKGGVIVTKVDKNKIYVNGQYESNDNAYFFLNRKNQVSYMFRVTYVDG